MSIVVNWDRADGQPGWHPVGDVAEATAFVEHLRNVEGIESSRIYRLDPVPFEWRAYYRAQVGAGAATSPSFTATVLAPPTSDPVPTAAPTAPAAPAAPAVEPLRKPAWATATPEPVVAEPEVDVEVEVEPDDEPVPTRRGLFGR